jgi:hypothetical protein
VKPFVAKSTDKTARRKGKLTVNSVMIGDSSIIVNPSLKEVEFIQKAKTGSNWKLDVRTVFTAMLLPSQRSSSSDSGGVPIYGPDGTSANWSLVLMEVLR